MKKKLIVFGVGDMAELAHFYFKCEDKYDLMGFVVDEGFGGGDAKFCGLPVFNLNEALIKFPADSCEFFVAIGYAKLNLARKEKYLYLKSMGYKFATYISDAATILNQGQIGENCFIFENNTIQPFVKIGNNVTLWSGNHVGHHSVIEDHVFIASHVVISGRVYVGEQTFIGVNATIRDHIKIGEKCIIGAGSLIQNNVPANGVYMGKETERSKVPSSRLRSI